VSQLTDDTNCIIQITNYLCVIHDRTLRTLIGVGEQRDGLYYFIGIWHDKAFKVWNIYVLDLWHKRIGYPSMKVTQLIPNVGRRTNGNKACDICQMAKQTRDSFPLSNNKANSSFELIHRDLWDPYKTSFSVCFIHIWHIKIYIYIYIYIWKLFQSL